MNEFKGTKGKWTTNNENVYDDLGSIVCNIAECDPHNKDLEAIANAKLIASAPELLESLKELYNAVDSCIDLTPEVLKRAKKLIEQATTL